MDRIITLFHFALFTGCDIIHNSLPHPHNVLLYRRKKLLKSCDLRSFLYFPHLLRYDRPKSERSPAMSRLIFHVDVNSAYLSWEAARRVANGESDLRLIPSAIGGDREKRTGVILAKSIPAKKYGVKTGEPVAMALRKCPDLVLARPDFRLYERPRRLLTSAGSMRRWWRNIPSTSASWT